MWSSLARLAGSPVGTPRMDVKGKSVSREDPLISFTRTWETLEATLRSSAAGLSLGQSGINNLLEQLLSLLTAERSASSTSSSPNSLGPCMEYLLQHGILATLGELALRDEPLGIRVEIIQWYGQAIIELDENFLIHKTVSHPLIKVLRSCLEQDGGLTRSDEASLVKVMSTICERIRTFPELLVIFFRKRNIRNESTAPGLTSLTSAALRSVAQEPTSNRPSSPTPSTSTLASTASHPTASVGSMPNHRRKSEHDFLLFSHLLRFVHREGRVGDHARAGLLYLIELAMDPTAPSTSTVSSIPLQRRNTSDTITSKSLPRSPISGATREVTLALAEYLLDSDFAEVLAAGLGALYGLLPGKLLVRAVGDATLSPGKDSASWDDPLEAEHAGGMVLGGMGALGNEEDPEEAERHQEEEDMRLEAMGVGISSTGDFREGLDGWLKLLEFTQNVLTRAPTSSGVMEDDDGEDETRQQQLLSSALTSSILSSLQSLFLQNVLYPSILECSDGDGSAVAVLSYIDSLLGIIDEGTKLESTILGFLMGEEDTPTSSRPRFSNNRSSRQKAPADRLMSSVLLSIEKSPREQLAQTSSYFSSLGRFSLKDLLAANLHSPSQPTATASLKLLHTMLTRHDRWSTGLLDVILDEKATYFPAPVDKNESREAYDAENLPTYAEEGNSDSETDEFVYPASKLPSPATPRANKSFNNHSNAFDSSELLLSSPLPPAPYMKPTSDSLNDLLALVASIDPAYQSARAVGGASEMLSTGFFNYLVDAEQALATDLSFTRGLSLGLTLQELSPLPLHRRKSTLFGPPNTLSAREFGTASTMYRHRLLPTSTVLSLILDSLSGFFSHSPDLNLALTGVITTLATCPYRSLEGWMLPPSKEVKGFKSLSEIVKMQKGNSTAPAAKDFERVDARSGNNVTPSPSTKGYSITADATSGSLLSTLEALAASVAHYRSTIPNFDIYLSERRQGLFFAENLLDALDLIDGGNSFGTAVKSLAETANPALITTPVKPKPTSRGFGAFLTPKPRSSAPTSNGDAFTTPRRDNLFGSGGSQASKAGPSSPFGSHYKQTGSISVKPIIVGPSSLSKGLHTEESSAEEDVQFDSPTKRLSPYVPSPSVMSEESEESSSVYGRGRSKRKEVQFVTLSAILDNCLVLEEFLKELAAVAYTRRSLGIDPLRFV